MVCTKLNLGTLYFMLRVSIIHDFIFLYFHNTTLDQYLYMMPSFPEIQFQSRTPLLAALRTQPFTLHCRYFHRQLTSFMSGYSTLCITQLWLLIYKMIMRCFLLLLLFCFLGHIGISLSIAPLWTEEYIFNILNVYHQAYSIIWIQNHFCSFQSDISIRSLFFST